MNADDAVREENLATVAVNAARTGTSAGAGAFAMDVLMIARSGRYLAALAAGLA